MEKGAYLTDCSQNNNNNNNNEFGPELGCLFNDDLISSLYHVYVSLHVSPVACCD